MKLQSRVESPVRRLFLEHPATVGESYAQHFAFASSIGLRLITMGLACVTHALIPAAFETTGSRGLEAIRREIKAARPGTLHD